MSFPYRVTERELNDYAVLVVFTVIDSNPKGACQNKSSRY